MVTFRQYEEVQQPAAEPCRIRRIWVVGLFHLYDHEITLRSKERVTLLVGPNGVGKTVLLRMVRDLVTARLGELLQVPFREFGIELGDKKVVVTVHRGEPEKPTKKRMAKGKHTTAADPTGTVSVAWYDGKDNPLVREMPLSELFWSGRSWPVEIPWLRPGPDEDTVFDERLGRIRFMPDAIREYGPLSGLGRRVTSPTPIDPILENLKRSVTSIHLIETQRLTRRNENRTRRYAEDTVLEDTVELQARTLSQRIRDRLAEYANISQKLDQTVPLRLISGPPAAQPRDGLGDRLKQLGAQRHRLMTLGLLQEAEQPELARKLDDLDSTKAAVMALYLEDSERKLAVLEDLARRIELFLDSVNHKFENKQIRIDRKAGFVAYDRFDDPLPLNALSSGEQQEIVLHFELLFEVQKNTLVLIDEPELSLHVAWQKRFLPELLGIADTAEIDVLVATHSPYILGDGHELVVELSTKADV